MNVNYEVRGFPGLKIETWGTQHYCFIENTG
jgi:hypothetical protein